MKAKIIKMRMTRMKAEIVIARIIGVKILIII